MTAPKCHRIHRLPRSKLAALTTRKRKAKPAGKRWRCSICGGFVPQAYADLHKATTQAEAIR